MVNPPRSEHSHSTAEAISAGVPMRPMGSWAMTRAGGRLRHAENAVLGGGVGGLTPDADDTGAGRDVDDRAAATRHREDLVLHGYEGAAQIDGDQAIPFLVAGLGQRLGCLFDACVVDPDVDRAERVSGRSHGSLDQVAVGHVADSDVRSPSVGSDQLSGLA